MEILAAAPLLPHGAVATRGCTEALKISKDFTSQKVTCAGLAGVCFQPYLCLAEGFDPFMCAKCCTQSSAGRGDPTNLWDKGWCQS